MRIFSFPFIKIIPLLAILLLNVMRGLMNFIAILSGMRCLYLQAIWAILLIFCKIEIWNSLIYQEKELKEELYKKHQEINQYKESIHSFLKNNKHKEIGIIFYKHRHFVFANQAAKEMIKININTNQGAPLTKALKSIAQQVEEYKSPQSCITKNSDGQRIVISGVPNLEKNHVIITVYYPDFSDIITTQINHLKDPSTWDYLLYLETTKPGQLINQLIPGSGEQLLTI